MYSNRTSLIIASILVDFWLFKTSSLIISKLLFINSINYVIKNKHVFKDKSKTGIVIEKDDSEDVLV